ncbi:MAG: hypothetical protein IPM34_01115 [Saprospiraceae bacterium]|nr:hypothetical protein [Saprospiraceae bacterium]
MRQACAGKIGGTFRICGEINIRLFPADNAEIAEIDFILNLRDLRNLRETTPRLNQYRNYLPSQNFHLFVLLEYSK